MVALTERAAAAHRAQVLILGLDEAAIDLPALGLQARVEQRVTGDLAGRIAAEKAELGAVLAELERRASGSATARPLRGVDAALDGFRRNLDESVRLLGAGRGAEARAFDREAVFPGCRLLDAALKASGGSYHERAAGADRDAKLGAIALLSGSACCVAGVVWRFDRSAWADPGHLRQILVNLAGNAVKFTDRGRVTLAARPEGERLAIDVFDTGIGIPAAALGDIFDEFRRADGSTARRFGGAGLSLSIARTLAMLEGGTIAVDSHPGHGSIFTLRLPAAPTCPLGSPAVGGRGTVEVGTSSGALVIVGERDLRRGWNPAGSPGDRPRPPPSGRVDDADEPAPASR